MAAKPTERKFQQVLNDAEKAFKSLHKSKSYHPKDLFSKTEYKALVESTAQVFDSVIPQSIPDELRSYLNADSFVFSALKTHAQLTEAKQLLKAENGSFRPYRDFEKDVLKINQAYNKNYLEAEYNFATQSSQSASNWHNLEPNAERYHLQYRTAADDHVRASHQVLHNITLPKTDPFWSQYYPPNGWRCRCTVVEVVAQDYTPSKSKQAIEQGEKATTNIGKSGKNKLEMFRFNPGIDKKIFPKDNSYSKVVGAKSVEQIVKKERQK